MKIISFAWTYPALLAGHKTVTRRHWSDRRASTFKAGDLVKATISYHIVTASI